MKHIFSRNIFYIFLIIILIFIQLWFSSLYRQISRDESMINEEYQAISFKTQILKAKIADLSSLSSIAKRAKKLGFIYAEDVAFLNQ